MKLDVILAVGLACFSLTTVTQAQEEPSELGDRAARWRNRAIQKIEAFKQDPTREGLIGLSGYLRVLERSHLGPEQVEVVKTLREAVFSLPNHADLYREELEELRADWKAGKITTPFDSERQQIVNTLGALPSPQVVGLLGELLYDLDRTEVKEGPIPVANAYLAQNALIRLLDDPPTTETMYHLKIRNRRTWQLWYEQVKAGTRTFRFKGDPQPYTLAGPAEKELRPAEAAPRERRSPPPSELPPGDLDEQSVSEGFPWLPLGLAGAVLIVAAAFVFRTKRRVR